MRRREHLPQYVLLLVHLTSKLQCFRAYPTCFIYIACANIYLSMECIHVSVPVAFLAQEPLDLQERDRIAEARAHHELVLVLLAEREEQFRRAARHLALALDGRHLRHEVVAQGVRWTVQRRRELLWRRDWTSFRA